MNSNKFIRTSVILALSLLFGCAIFIIIVDPWFHFHKPLNGLQYPMNNEYYQNAGIARNFDYEAVIAGDSMTQNTKASIVKSLWGFTTVKLPNPGAPLVETDKCVNSALKHNKSIKLVIRQLDGLMLNRDPFLERYGKSDQYMWDDNPFNDVKYIFSKESFIDAFTVLTYTRAGKTTPSFDEYSNVTEDEDYGNLESLRKYLQRSYDFGYTEDEDIICAKAIENIQNNVIKTAMKYPEVDFYYYVPAYSAPFWSEVTKAGVFDKVIECERAALKELVDIPNIKVFYFQNEFDISTDWSHYSDEVHVDEEVLDYMFVNMKEGNKLLTSDNIDQWIDEVRDFYSSFDYNSLLNE